MFDALVEGCGELVLAFLDDDVLVSGTMVVDGRQTSTYASAVNDRSRFDKPLGHWPLYNAIVRSKQRGLRYFDLGEIPPQGTASEKQYSIGQFKKGFTSRLEFRLHWCFRP